MEDKRPGGERAESEKGQVQISGGSTVWKRAEKKREKHACCCSGLSGYWTNELAPRDMCLPGRIPWKPATPSAPSDAHPALRRHEGGTQKPEGSDGFRLETSGLRNRRGKKRQVGWRSLSDIIYDMCNSALRAAAGLSS